MEQKLDFPRDLIRVLIDLPCCFRLMHGRRSDIDSFDYLNTVERTDRNSTRSRRLRRITETAIASVDIDEGDLDRRRRRKERLMELRRKLYQSCRLDLPNHIGGFDLDKPDAARSN
jgi:hypothetical protein